MKKSKISVIVIAAFVTIVALANIILPDGSYSLTERRRLAQFPSLSVSNVLSGSFMSEYETYSQDQFIFREQLRSLKAILNYKVFGRLENHGIYIQDGHAAKLEYEINLGSTSYAAKRFEYVYNTFIKDGNNKVYLSVIPDKTYYMGGGKYPVLDADAIAKDIAGKMPYAEYIDIKDMLRLDSYYKTDPHWRQEEIGSVAQYILREMRDFKGFYNGDAVGKSLDVEYRGVYAGQAAYPMDSETIYYLSSDTIDNARVFNYETNKETGVYNFEKADGRDPYEFFLSGSISLLKITNPKSNTGRKLVMFRDSFGSSLAPLFIEAYDEITLVDIRYIQPETLGRFIEIKDSDVLFIYSSSVMNNSSTIK